MPSANVHPDRFARRRGVRCRTLAATAVCCCIAAACSGDSGVSSGSAVAATSATDRASTTTSTVVTAATTTTTGPKTTVATGPADTTAQPTSTSTSTVPEPSSTVPAARTKGFAASFTIPQSDIPSAYATALLPAGHGRGFLLVATAQAALGARFDAAIWESPDGVSWQRTEAPALGSGGQSFASDATWVQESLVVGGSYNDQTGSHPSVWIAPDGRTFGAAEDAYAGATGFVSAVAPGPVGLVVAGRIETTGATRAVAALRDARGRWTQADLLGNDSTVSGIATIGPNVVVTGSSRPVSITQATAWVSTDGGLSFTQADTSSISAPVGTSLGRVTTWSQGFVAPACVAGPSGPTVALATSADGNVWKTLPISAVDDAGQPYPYLGTECSTISSSGDRILVGVNELDSAVLDLDTTGAGRALYAPRTQGHVSSAAPLAVLGNNGVLAVSSQTRGLAAGAESGGSRIAASSTGLPEGAPAVYNVTIGPVIAGTAASVAVYPVVTEGSGGYTAGPARSWLQSPELKNWTITQAFDRTGIDYVASTGTLDVGFGTGDDPGDTADAGPVKGIEAWSRGDGEQWQSHGIVAGGPGGQYVNDLRIFDGGFIAVGGSSTRDQQTGAQSSTPVALTSADGVTWTAENVPAVGQDTVLTRACPLPGGNVLAFGTATGASTAVFAVVRTAGGTWTHVDAAVFGGFTGSVECARTADRALVVFNDADRPAIISTADGTTLTRVDLTDEGFVGAQFDGVVPVGDRFVIGGVSRLRGAARPQLWISNEGRDAVPVLVDGWAAVADETVTGVALAFGHVVVSGTRNGQPTVWAVKETDVPTV